MRKMLLDILRLKQDFFLNTTFPKRIPQSIELSRETFYGEAFKSIPIQMVEKVCPSILDSPGMRGGSLTNFSICLRNSFVPQGGEGPTLHTKAVTGAWKNLLNHLNSNSYKGLSVYSLKAKFYRMRNLALEKVSTEKSCLNCYRSKSI